MADGGCSKTKKFQPLPTKIFSATIKARCSSEEDWIEDIRSSIDRKLRASKPHIVALLHALDPADSMDTFPIEPLGSWLNEYLDANMLSPVDALCLWAPGYASLLVHPRSSRLLIQSRIDSHVKRRFLGPTTYTSRIHVQTSFSNSDMIDNSPWIRSWTASTLHSILQ